MRDERSCDPAYRARIHLARWLRTVSPHRLPRAALTVLFVFVTLAMLVTAMFASRHHEVTLLPGIRIAGYFSIFYCLSVSLTLVSFPVFHNTARESDVSAV